LRLLRKNERERFEPGTSARILRDIADVARLSCIDDVGVTALSSVVGARVTGVITAGDQNQ
jgi:hypothetical protein